MRQADYKDKELDVSAIRSKISNSTIEFTSHIDEIESRPGRPERKFVESHLTEKLNKLYKAQEGRKGRTILYFYLSRKYDLVIIARFEGKALKVITYYNYLKKRLRI